MRVSQFDFDVERVAVEDSEFVSQIEDVAEEYARVNRRVNSRTTDNRRIHIIRATAEVLSLTGWMPASHT